MVKMLRRLSMLGFALMLLAPVLCAYQVALRNGAVIHFQNYRLVNNELLYLSESGEERSVLLTDINFARTKELNMKENPPLDVEGMIKQMNVVRKAAAAKPAAPPLGDVAHQLGLKGEIDAEGRLFTNDDFPSSPNRPAPVNVAATPSPVANAARQPSAVASAPTANSDWAASRAKIEQFLRKTENLTEQQYVARLLGSDLAEVEFPTRAAWQTEIYRQHLRYSADAKLCISDRVSDEGRRQDDACARLDSDKSGVQSLRDTGKAQAQEWKSRQEATTPY
jgi:hypothetical protein